MSMAATTLEGIPLSEEENQGYKGSETVFYFIFNAHISVWLNIYGLPKKTVKVLCHHEDIQSNEE